MKRYPYRLLLLLPVFCFLFLGCGKDDPCDNPPSSKRRTVLVYLGTDNNFSHEAAEKIDILKKKWKGSNDGNLLVYADAGANPVLVHIYHSKLRGNVADTINIYAVENSADPATFARMLHRAKEYRPADSYGLVVLSHATGWLPAEMSHPDIALKSVILDTGADEANNYMELSDFVNAIPYPLDFIVFDACFMGSVEVCYELKDKVAYIVSSPAEVLAPGFVYSTMMQHLFAPVADLTAVARDFYEYYDSRAGFYRSATVSVVKTSELEALATVVSEIIHPNIHPNDFENIQTFGYGRQKIYFDLGDYLQKLSPENRQRIQNALNQCIIYKAHTPSYYSAGTRAMHAIQAFSGLTVYIPQAAYPQTNNAYGMLKWTERTGVW